MNAEKTSLKTSIKVSICKPQSSRGSSRHSRKSRNIIRFVEEFVSEAVEVKANETVIAIKASTEVVVATHGAYPLALTTKLHLHSLIESC